MTPTDSFLTLPDAEVVATNRFFDAIRSLSISGPDELAIADWIGYMERWPPRVAIHVLRTVLAFTRQLVIDESDTHAYQHHLSEQQVGDLKQNMAAFVMALNGLSSHPGFEPPEAADTQLVCDRLARLPFGRRWWIVSRVVRLLIEWVLVAGGTGIPDSYLDWPLRERLAELKNPRERLF